jgi:hypothetical protein
MGVEGDGRKRKLRVVVCGYETWRVGFTSLTSLLLTLVKLRCALRAVDHTPASN